MKRLCFSLVLALCWYGVVAGTTWGVQMERGPARLVLHFPHEIMVWLVETLAGLWSPLGRWLYAPPRMLRAAVAGLSLYLCFWWAVFYVLFPSLGGLGGRLRRGWRARAA
jgi:hypothetical protein